MNYVESVSMESFLEDFNPTFENFVRKCPLNPTVTLVKDTGHLTIKGAKNINSEPFEFTFVLDPTKNKKDQIKQIKLKLEKHYPIIFETKYVRLSDAEIEDQVSQGVPIKVALNERKELYYTRYIIKRVHHQYNELDVFDIKTRRLVKYKFFKKPVGVYLKELFNDPMNVSKEFFNDEVARFAYCIDKPRDFKNKE